jgi:hypothetical protein
LPLPVGASHHKLLDVSDSSISRIAGIESDWIGVGISQPVRLVTSSKSFDRPRGSKLSASESELDDAFVEIMMLRSDSCRDARGDGANENAYEPLCTDAMIITAVVSCSRDNLMMTVGWSAVDYLLPVLTVSQCGAVLWLMVGSHVDGYDGGMSPAKIGMGNGVGAATVIYGDIDGHPSQVAGPASFTYASLS